MKRILFIILCTVLLLSLSGCKKDGSTSVLNGIPEGAEIQKLLDNMSNALKTNDLEAYSEYISSTCPQRAENLKRLKELISTSPFTKYQMKVISGSQQGEGIVCSLDISGEISADKKTSPYIDSKEYLFIKENGSWRLGDLNYHPFINPTVIVGDDSAVYDAASELADTLSSKLYTDKTHLQLYGDIIMVGEAYDNASIVDLELRGLTPIRVTDDYPGDGKGVVQVLSGIDQYRYVILIQGSGADTAAMSVEFMKGYLAEKQFMLPGVYIIEDNKIRASNPLELSTITTFDREQSEEKLFEIQNNIEKNIDFIEEEIANEKDQLINLQKITDTPFVEDFYAAFSKQKGSTILPQENEMLQITASFTEKELCKAAFGLPGGGNEGGIYAFSDYVRANPVQNSLALLRLSGFLENQVYRSINADGNLDFFAIGNGFALDPFAKERTGVKNSFSITEAVALENDRYYVNYKNFTSNMEKSKISELANKLNLFYKSNRDINENRVGKTNFKEDEKIKSEPFHYNTDTIFDMLKKNTLEDDLPLHYSTLSEAKEYLRSAMGDLLSILSTQALYKASSKFPGSQYDYARISAGFLNNEHAYVYAQAAEKDELVKEVAHSIQIKGTDYEDRLNEIVQYLKEMEDVPEIEGRFMPPERSIENKKASPRDKALLAFGLYLNVFGNGENAYVVLGRDSSYLTFEKDGEWRFLDCKSMRLEDYIDDDVTMSFNLLQVYNEELELGEVQYFTR